MPIRIRLLPGSAAEWASRFNAWRSRHGRKRIVKLIDQFLPASMARSLIQQAGVGAETIAAGLSREQRQILSERITAAPLTVIGAGGWDEAIVTRGGVSLREVRPETLQSRCVQGLFFAGEILDLDGPTGGFNLQWAFSSGWLAGQSCMA